MVRAVVLCVGLLAGAVGVAASVWPTSTGGSVVPKPDRILDGVSGRDASLLRDFYAAMADIVVRDGKSQEPVCKTVFDLRNRHKSALSMAFANTGMTGKYPGLGERLDQYLLSAIGSLDVPLTPELRQSAAKAFAAIN